MTLQGRRSPASTTWRARSSAPPRPRCAPPGSTTATSSPATRCPTSTTVDGIISFGGAQSVTEIDRYPYLLAEADVPQARGGARRSPSSASASARSCSPTRSAAACSGSRSAPWSWAELRHTAEDPLTATLPDPVYALHWNEDAIEPPPGATELLERGGLGCAAFRLGSAWGVQFHADVDGPVLDGWYERYGDWVDRGRRRSGRRAAADEARHLPGQAATAQALFGGFVTRARAARARAPR